MRLVLIPPDKLQAAWPHIESFVNRIAEDSEGKTTLADMHRYGLTGDYLYWAVLDESGDPVALVVVEIIRYAAGPAVSFFACVGLGRRRWAHLKSVIEEWAKARGCVLARMVCRPGWERQFPDYEKKHVVLEKPL